MASSVETAVEVSLDLLVLRLCVLLVVKPGLAVRLQELLVDLVHHLPPLYLVLLVLPPDFFLPLQLVLPLLHLGDRLLHLLRLLLHC